MTIQRIFNDVVKVNLDIFDDNRGIFFELYNKDFFSFFEISLKLVWLSLSRMFLNINPLPKSLSLSALFQE